MGVLASGLVWSFPSGHGNSQRHFNKAREAVRTDTASVAKTDAFANVLHLGNKQCPVDGRLIDSSAVLVLRKNLLVSLSSEVCRQEFAKDPDGYTRKALKIVGRELP